MNATGVAYVSTKSYDELTTVFASVDNRTDGAPLAFRRAKVAQLT